MELFAEYKLNTFNPSEKHKLRVCYLIFYLMYLVFYLKNGKVKVSKEKGLFK